MNPTLKAALVYLNNYGHDLATAFFFVTTLFAWWTRRKLPELYPDLETRLKITAWISFLAILILGGVRTGFYKEFEWLPALQRHQVHILAAKHVILVLLTLWAVAAWFRMKRS